MITATGARELVTAKDESIVPDQYESLQRSIEDAGRDGYCATRVTVDIDQIKKTVSMLRRRGFYVEQTKINHDSGLEYYEVLIEW